jgi:hypothetical protein
MLRLVTARVSELVKITKPILEPAARIVFTQSMFSTVQGDRLGACNGMEVQASDKDGTGNAFLDMPLRNAWLR